MDNTTTPQTRYFEKRDISVSPGEIVLVSCMRNEYPRLPYFLDYYRRLGVSQFFMVDNDSTDETAEFLKAQPDVRYFWTDASYRGSAAGRLWTQELADTYARDRWVVTADVDELLVYPGIEEFDLHALCEYMDSQEQCGLFTVLLDMYSDKPLSEARYTPGHDFLETCAYFETDTYTLRPGSDPPFLNIGGGPRGRIFEGTGPGPMMKKVPLVKWHEGFSYIFSTHSHRFVQLSDITGALLHFKFFASFQEVAATDAKRGDRRRTDHYTAYSDGVGGQLLFYGEHSRRWTSPRDLVALGIMKSTRHYAAFAAHRLGLTAADLEDDPAEAQAEAEPGIPTFDEPGIPAGDESGDSGEDPEVAEQAEDSAAAAAETDPQAVDKRARLDRILPDPDISSVEDLTIRAIHRIWPFVSNPQLPRYFGKVEPSRPDHRSAFLSAMRGHIKVVDIRHDHLVIRLSESAVHRRQRSGLALAVYVDGCFQTCAMVDGTSAGVEIDHDSLEPNIYRFSMDMAGIVARSADRESAHVEVYLIDGTEDPRVDARPGQPGTEPGDNENPLFSRRWYAQGAVADGHSRYRGQIGAFKNSQLHAWAYDADVDRFNQQLVVYINGRFARVVKPLRWRGDLGAQRISGDRAGRAVVEPLPIGVFKADKDPTLTIEVVIAGTGVALMRSPLVIPTGVTSARWAPRLQRWEPVTEDAAAAPAAGPAPSLRQRVRARLGRVRRALR